MNEFNEKIKDSKPTLVDFFATWCGPCKAQAPILEDVKSSIGDIGNILKVDIDKNQELAMQYNVRSVPTLIMFKNGVAVWRAVGLQHGEVLVDKFHEHAENKKDQ